MEKKLVLCSRKLEYKYKLIPVDINNGEQFKENFKKISPFSKIPVIIDHENNQTIFESGAILIYLAEQSGKFYNKENRLEIKSMVNGSDGICWSDARSTSSISSLQSWQK